MARKRVYIQGAREGQFFSDGQETCPVNSFWHIQKPRATFVALCGMSFDAIDESPTAPTLKKTLCTFCVRIAEGRDPIFDSRTEQASSRSSEDRGTVAKAPKPGLVNRGGGGKVVA